jgi:hypothetical protein
VFKEPISLASDRVRDRLKRDLALISSAKTSANDDKRQIAMEKKGALRIAQIEAEGLAVWPKRLIWLGVAVNLCLLLSSSLWASGEISSTMAVCFLALSTLPYMIAIAWLALIAGAKIHSIIGD